MTVTAFVKKIDRKFRWFVWESGKVYTILAKKIDYNTKKVLLKICVVMAVLVSFYLNMKFFMVSVLPVLPIQQ